MPPSSSLASSRARAHPYLVGVLALALFAVQCEDDSEPMHFTALEDDMLLIDVLGEWQADQGSSHHVTLRLCEDKQPSHGFCHDKTDGLTSCHEIYGVPHGADQDVSTEVGCDGPGPSAGTMLLGHLVKDGANFDLDGTLEMDWVVAQAGTGSPTSSSDPHSPYSRVYEVSLSTPRIAGHVPLHHALVHGRFDGSLTMSSLDSDALASTSLDDAGRDSSISSSSNVLDGATDADVDANADLDAATDADLDASLDASYDAAKSDASVSSKDPPLAVGTLQWKKVKTRAEACP